MATEWKSQVGGGKYAIQFETTSYEYYKIVEKACQSAVDRAGTEAQRERKSQTSALGTL